MMEDNIKTFQTSSDDIGKRLDKFLKDQMHDISRSNIQDLIQQGCVSVNGQIVTVNRTKLSLDALISVDISKQLVSMSTNHNLLPNYDTKLDILYEDDDLLIVNKQPGLTVHPGAGNKENTLLNALIARDMPLSDMAGEARPGIVHRIDKDTSGILVVAKHNKAHYALSQQIMDHSCKRVYKALCYNVPVPTYQGLY